MTIFLIYYLISEVEIRNWKDRGKMTKEVESWMRLTVKKYEKNNNI